MKKLITIGAVVLVLALLLTLAPACGKEKGEVKTLKMGLLLPFSGPGAAWGVPAEQGANWAIDEVNAAGGIKVGADRYLIELVKCDTKMTGSVAAECATRFVYDEHIHYAIGAIVTNPAMNPILTEGMVLDMLIGNMEVIGPEAPYCLINCAPIPQWMDTFWKQAYQFHPEIQTVAIASDTGPSGDYYLTASQAAHAHYGREVIHVARYEPFTTDFYPVLTPLVAKNPDAIDLSGGNIGDQDLIVKQARELGYKGIIAGGQHGPVDSLLEVAGSEYAEGFLVNDPDYSCELYSEESRELYAEYQQLYPGQPLNYLTYLGYSSAMFWVQAIEEADSIDPEEVVKVLDDPEWEFEWFGTPGVTLGGLETYGIRRCVQDEVGYGEVINGERVQMSRGPVVVP